MQYLLVHSQIHVVPPPVCHIISKMPMATSRKGAASLLIKKPRHALQATDVRNQNLKFLRFSSVCQTPPAPEKDCQLMANKRQFDLHPLKPLKPKRMTHRPETHPPGNTNVAGQCPRQSEAGDAALQLRCQGQSHRLCPQGKPLRLPNFHCKLSIFKNDFKMSSNNPDSSKPV